MIKGKIENEQELRQITLTKASLDNLRAGAELLADIMTCLALGIIFVIPTYNPVKSGKLTQKQALTH